MRSISSGNSGTGALGPACGRALPKKGSCHGDSPRGGGGGSSGVDGFAPIFSRVAQLPDAPPAVSSTRAGSGVMARAARPGCGLRTNSHHVRRRDAKRLVGGHARSFERRKLDGRARTRTRRPREAQKGSGRQERKRKREAEKARIAQYEEAAAQEAASSAHESPGARSRRVVKTYLDNPPYFGSSNFEDHKAVVELCKGTKNRLEVNKQTKPWQYGTNEMAAVPRLIGSGLWHPVGVMPKDHALLVKTIGEMEMQEAIAAERRVAEKTNASELHAEQPRSERSAKRRSGRGRTRGRDPDHVEHVEYLKQIGFGENVEALLEQSARGPT